MYCSNQSNLNQHIDKCLNIRNHKCEECGEAFVEERTLNDHLERKHSDERNYVCDFKGCGKAFKTKVDLSNHKKKQSDKKHVLIVKKSLQNTSRPSRTCFQ